MGKSNDFDTNWLTMFFYGSTVGATGIFVSGAATQYWAALHISGVSTSGQNVNEANYGGYVRVAVARTSGAWTLISSTAPPTVSPNAAITFAAATTSGSDITNFSIGSASAGTGKVYYFGTVTPNIAVTAAGVTPSLTTASTISES